MLSEHVFSTEPSERPGWTIYHTTRGEIESCLDRPDGLRMADLYAGAFADLDELDAMDAAERAATMQLEVAA